MTLPRVYFYCSDEPGNLQEDIIAIAEGLKELGVPYHANCNYWLRSTDPGDYLFRHNPEVTPDDCDVVVVAYTWPQWVRMGTFDMIRKPLPHGLFKPRRTYATVYMDNHDGYRTISWEPEYRQFDLILRTKFNRRAWHPDNMHPWAYGWTNRIIEATDKAPAFASRKRALVVNFGASHPFPYRSRDISRTRFEPRIGQVLELDRTVDDLAVEPHDDYARLMWRQTGGRFSRAYYERLKHTQAVACFCGDIIPPAPKRPDRYLVGGNRARLRRLFHRGLSWLDPRAPRAVGRDSFRFWEAFAAECAAINVDLEHYGVQMPVMPKSGLHYLGVDFAKVDRAVAQVRDDPESLHRIASAGRNWAEANYAPRAVAKRFLEIFFPGAVEATAVTLTNASPHASQASHEGASAEPGGCFMC